MKSNAMRKRIVALRGKLLRKANDAGPESWAHRMNYRTADKLASKYGASRAVNSAIAKMKLRRQSGWRWVSLRGRSDKARKTG